MSTSNFESGRTTPLLIPEPVWREWKMNGVDAEGWAELEAEFGDAVGYEFNWGQIIEEVFDVDCPAGSGYPNNVPCVAVRWYFVLRDVHTEFVDGGGSLGELSDLATVIFADTEHLRDELSEALGEETLPACISFDEGNNISAFAVCVLGQSNVVDARQWMSSFFIPGVLPILFDQLRRESEAALNGNAADATRH